MADEAGTAVSSIGVKLTLDASGFTSGLDAAQGKLNTFQRQAARAGSGVAATKAGGGEGTPGSPRHARGIDGVNVSLTISDAELGKLRGQITKGLGAIPITVTPQFARSGPGSLQNILGGMLSAQYGLSPAAGREAATRTLKVFNNIYPQRAHGGPVQQGRPVIVGERRAEVFIPKTGGYIEPSVADFHKKMEQQRRREAEIAALEFQQQQQHERRMGAYRGAIARSRGPWINPRAGTRQEWLEGRSASFDLALGSGSRTPRQAPYSRTPLSNFYEPPASTPPWPTPVIRKVEGAYRGKTVRGYGGKYGSARPGDADLMYGQRVDTSDPRYNYHGTSWLDRIRYGSSVGSGVAPRSYDWVRESEKPISWWTRGGFGYSGAYGSGLVRARHDDRFMEVARGAAAITNQRVPLRDLQYWGEDNNWHRFRRGRSRQGGGPTYARFGTRRAMLQPGESVPPPLGTVPLREGYVRGYHATKANRWGIGEAAGEYRDAKQNLDLIRQRGLRLSHGQGHLYGEPDAMWFNNSLKGYDEDYSVEAHLPARWFDRSRKYRHDPPTIGGPNSNMAVMGDVSRRRFATYNEPWMRTYRHLVERMEESGRSPGSMMREYGRTFSHFRNVQDQRRSQTPTMLPYEGETQAWDQFIAEMWHRRRARHAWRGATARAYQLTLEQGGGTFPVDPRIPVPARGHALGISAFLPGAQSYHVPKDDPIAFMRAFHAQKRAGAPYVGTWIDPETGLIDVDPSTVVFRKRAADMVLRGGGEKAAYDIGAGLRGADDPVWYASDKRLRARRSRLMEIIKRGRMAGGPVKGIDEHIEQVRLETMLNLREIDREAHPRFAHDYGYLDELTERVRAEGIQRPIELWYSPSMNAATVADGNHRLAVAARLGMKTVPVVVMVPRGQKLLHTKRLPGEPVNLPEGFYPPSRIGLKQGGGPVHAQHVAGRGRATGTRKAKQAPYFLGRARKLIEELAGSISPRDPGFAAARDWYTIAHAQALGDMADFGFLGLGDIGIGAYAAASPGKAWPTERAIMREILRTGGQSFPKAAQIVNVPGYSPVSTSGEAYSYESRRRAAEIIRLRSLVDPSGKPLLSGPKVVPFHANLTGADVNAKTLDARMSRIANVYEIDPKTGKKVFGAYPPGWRRSVLEQAYGESYEKWGKAWGLNNFSEFQAILWSAYGRGDDLGTDWARTKSGIAIPRHRGLVVPLHRASGGQVIPGNLRQIAEQENIVKAMTSTAANWAKDPFMAIMAWQAQQAKNQDQHRQEGGPVWERLLSRASATAERMGKRASKYYRRRAAGFKRLGLNQEVGYFDPQYESPGYEGEFARELMADPDMRWPSRGRRAESRLRVLAMQETDPGANRDIGDLLGQLRRPDQMRLSETERRNRLQSTSTEGSYYETMILKDRLDQLKRFGFSLDDLNNRMSFTDRGPTFDASNMPREALILLRDKRRGPNTWWRDIDEALERLPKDMGPLGRGLPTSPYRYRWPYGGRRWEEGPVAVGTRMSYELPPRHGEPGINSGSMIVNENDLRFNDPTVWTEAGYKTTLGMLKGRNNFAGGPVEPGPLTRRILKLPEIPQPQQQPPAFEPEWLRRAREQKLPPKVFKQGGGEVLELFTHGGWRPSVTDELAAHRRWPEILRTVGQLQRFMPKVMSPITFGMQAPGYESHGMKAGAHFDPATWGINFGPETLATASGPFLRELATHEAGHALRSWLKYNSSSQSAAGVNAFDLLSLQGGPISDYPQRRVSDVARSLVLSNVIEPEMLERAMDAGLSENFAETFAALRVGALHGSTLMHRHNLTGAMGMGSWSPIGWAMNISKADKQLSEIFDDRFGTHSWDDPGLEGRGRAPLAVWNSRRSNPRPIGEREAELKQAMARLLHSNRSRLRAAGGESALDGLYIVGEIGKELFVPNRLAHLIPPQVMEQIPRKAGGGIVEIGKKRNELFAPPEDGIIIPNRLIDKVPHAAFGDVVRGIGGALGATPYQPVVPRNPLAGGDVGMPIARLAAAVERLVGSFSGAPRSGPAAPPPPPPAYGVGGGYQPNRQWTYWEGDTRSDPRADAGRFAGGPYRMYDDGRAGGGGGGVGGRRAAGGGAGGGGGGRGGPPQAGATFAGSNFADMLRESSSEMTAWQQVMSGRTPRGLVAQLASMGIGGRTQMYALQNQARMQAARLAKESGTTVEGPAFTSAMGEQVAAGPTTLGNLGAEYMALQAKLMGARGDEAKSIRSQMDAIEGSSDATKKFIPQLKEWQGSVQKLQPTTGGMLRNLGTIIGATSLYGYAMQAASMVLDQAVIPATAKFLDQMGGWRSTFTTTTTNLADQTRQMGGNVSAAIAATAATSGMSKATFDWVESAAGATITVKAGAKSFAEAREMMRAAIGATETPQGMYGGYGGLFGSALFAEQLGGGQGFQEEISGALEGAGVKRKMVSAPPGVYAPGGVPGEAITTASSDKIMSDIAAAMRRAADRDGGPRYGIKRDLTTEQRKAIEGADLPAEYKKMARLGYAYSDSTGQVITSLDKLNEALEQAAEGYTIPDRQVWIEGQRRQIEAQNQVALEQQQRTINVEIPVDIWKGLLQQPLLAPGAGVVGAGGVRAAGFTGQTATWAEGLIKQIGQSNTQIQGMAGAGMAAAAQDIMKYNPGAMPDFAKQATIATLAAGKIADLNNQIAKLSQEAAQASWANQIRIARRGLSDALGMLGRVGGSRLGQLQREQYLISRASTQLSLQLQQRQITTQLALAQFQAPGETGEERYFRQKQAVAEAGVAQQQLNFSFREFTISGKVWKITAERAATDAQKAMDVMLVAQNAQLGAALAQQAISNEQRKLSASVGKIDAMLGTARSKWNTNLNAAAQYAATFGGAVKTAINEIYSALGYTKNRAGQWVKPDGSKPPQVNPSTGFVTGATGLLGTTGGPTNMLVGEAGKEVVAVLRNPRTASVAPQAGGGSMSVVVNINGTTVRSEQDISTLAQRVAAEVERTLARKGQMFGLRGPAV